LIIERGLKMARRPFSPAGRATGSITLASGL